MTIKNILRNFLKFALIALSTSVFTLSIAAENKLPNLSVLKKIDWSDKDEVYDIFLPLAPNKYPKHKDGTFKGLPDKKTLFEGGYIVLNDMVYKTSLRQENKKRFAFFLLGDTKNEEKNMSCSESLKALKKLYGPPKIENNGTYNDTEVISSQWHISDTGVTFNCTIFSSGFKFPLSTIDIKHRLDTKEMSKIIRLSCTRNIKSGRGEPKQDSPITMVLDPNKESVKMHYKTGNVTDFNDSYIKTEYVGKEGATKDLNATLHIDRLTGTYRYIITSSKKNEKNLDVTIYGNCNAVSDTAKF